MTAPFRILLDRILQTMRNFHTGIGYVVFSDVNAADEALEKLKVCGYVRNVVGRASFKAILT